jgi:hypothetical protein
VIEGENADAVLIDVPLAEDHHAAKATDKKISDLRKFRREVQDGDKLDKHDLVSSINNEIELSMQNLNIVVQEVLFKNKQHIDGGN